MEVGFKGNPNIGSVVLNQIAHSVDFGTFASEFIDGDRIFIISSIFGGTGASGFPLLLKTLRTGNNFQNYNIINHATIGAITMLPYFKLKPDDNSEIPNTMELRHDYDDYTQWMSNNIGLLNSSDAVFQQKNLSSMSSDAYNTYARVLIQHYSFSPGEVEHHYESPGLVAEDYRNLKEMVDDEIKPYTYIDTPTWHWIDIDGIKAIEGDYRRNGEDGPVKCKFYLLSNYNEMVKIIVTYREKDGDYWESDLNNIIRTFKWTSPR